MNQLGQLLTIDVEAEIRKLCGRQLGNPADQVVELIRVAIRAGARSVAVRLGLRRISVASKGGFLSESGLRWLSAVANPHLPGKDRHAALLRCEAEQGVGLLSLVTSPFATVVSNGPGGEHLLRMRAGAAPRYTRREGGEPSILVSVARQASRRQTRQALERACRFSQVPVFLGRRQISGAAELDECLLRRRMVLESLVCDVGLPLSGELCQTVVLQDELLLEETFGVSPRGFVHLAVLRGRTGRAVDVNAEVHQVIQRARASLYAALREQLPRLQGAYRRVARDLLFRRLERGGDEIDLAGAAIFQRLAGDPVDLAALRHASRAGTVWAVEPLARHRRYLVEPESVFVLDARERALLTEHLHILCQEPPSLTRRSPWSALRQWLRLSVRVLSRASGAVVGRWIAGQPVSSAELSGGEHCLMRLVQAELSEGRFSLPGISARLSERSIVEVCERGSLPLRPRRRGDRLVVSLPRRHNTVVRMVAAVQSDVTNILPVMAMLFGGHDGYGRAKMSLHESALARQ